MGVRATNFLLSNLKKAAYMRLMKTRLSISQANTIQDKRVRKDRLSSKEFKLKYMLDLAKKIQIKIEELEDQWDLQKFQN
jgi:polyhydroxyalkanoate synthesis regulator phasin